MSKQFTSINVNKEYVHQRLQELCNELDVCKCEQCVHDIEAIVLNNLPPHYANSEKGNNYIKTELMQENNLKILDEQIHKAAKIVKASPRHN